jgi:hypothetical protein
VTKVNGVVNGDAKKETEDDLKGRARGRRNDAKKETEDDLKGRAGQGEEETMRRRKQKMI